MLVRTIACVALSLWMAGLATAQSRQTEWDEERGRAGARYERDDRYDRDYDSRWSVRGGIGFTADPGTFLTAFELPYSINDSWTIGPLIRIGVDDRETVVMPTLNVRFFPDFGQRNADDEIVRKLRPYFHGGLGLVHIDLDTKFRDRDDTEFLFNMGFGMDYPISRRFSLGSQLSFNVVPDGALGEKFIFSWQLLNATYQF